MTGNVTLTLTGKKRKNSQGDRKIRKAPTTTKTEEDRGKGDEGATSVSQLLLR